MIFFFFLALNRTDLLFSIYLLLYRNKRNKNRINQPNQTERKKKTKQKKAVRKKQRKNTPVKRGPLGNVMINLNYLYREL